LQKPLDKNRQSTPSFVVDSLRALIFAGFNRTPDDER